MDGWTTDAAKNKINTPVVIMRLELSKESLNHIMLGKMVSMLNAGQNEK